jgi:hypothetical protein
VRIRSDPRPGGIHPVDVLLLLASQEGDMPKIEEARAACPRYLVSRRRCAALTRLPPLAWQLLEAGADVAVKDLAGNTPMARRRTHAKCQFAVSSAALADAQRTRTQMLAGKANPGMTEEVQALLAAAAKK